MASSSPRPKKQSPLLQRSRSGASRFGHVSSSPDHPPPLSPNLSLSLSLSLSRSKPSPAAAELRRARSKENFSGAGAAASPRPGGVGARRPRPGASAWALSPGRSPPRAPETAPPPRRRSVDGGAGGGGGKVGGGGGGGVLAGLFRRRRKEPSAKEEAAHQLRILSARLLQWRFANARAAAAIVGAESVAQKKLFYAWIRMSELRKAVAAKQIMVQRRRQKLKLMRILNRQVQLLVRWEPLAKQHIEAVAVLGRVLGTACISLPLVEGAQANMVSLHRYFRESMSIMKDVEANTKTFYSKVATTNSTLGELMETVQSEIEGLQQLKKLSKVITTLEMHELSLRAHQIQAINGDGDDDDITYPKY